jgi:hypothetical protein
MAKPSFCLEKLPLAISQLRSDNQIPTLDNVFYDGGQCRIFQASFSSDETWSIRVPLHEQVPQRAVIDFLRDEILILEKLKQNGFGWAPTLRGFSLSFENLVNYPFIALSWIPGKHLRWGTDFPTRPIRDKILAQLARMIVSLAECTNEYSKLNSLLLTEAY